MIERLRLALLLSGFVGLVFASPPPAVARVDDENFFTHLHTEKAMANVTITPARAGPVEIMVQLETVDEAPLSATAVSVTLTGPQAGMVTLKSAAERTSDDQWRALLSLPSSGRWNMSLVIKLSENDEVTIASPILIR